MNIYELIRRKRDRGRTSPEELSELVAGYSRGKVPDYQLAAWLMAVFFRGMGAEETAALTDAMMRSGDVLDLGGIAGPKVDKHSTGGVGDKVSLILAPLVAACGVVVPMVSGRSLGHTGGTLDKLESIPGFRTALSADEFRRNLGRVGVSIMGQTDRLCPADRKMYALRDVTATVDSVPLIAASIMSKKLAEGIDGLVLDVKTGTGAFMPRVPQARKLARVMMNIGSRMGKKVVAVITGMWEPLGRAVGNALEVVESIEALKGSWPMDLEEVTLALGEEMLLLAGRAGSRAQARRLLLRAIADGSGLDRFRKLVETQGGNAAVADDYRLLPRARSRVEVRAAAPGHVRSIDALQVGLLGIELGVGRRRLGDRVDPAAGFLFHKKVGDRVEANELLAEVFGRSRKRVQPVVERLEQAIVIGRSAPRPASRIVARLTRC